MLKSIIYDANRLSSLEQELVWFLIEFIRLCELELLQEGYSNFQFELDIGDDKILVKLLYADEPEEILDWNVYLAEQIQCLAEDLNVDLTDYRDKLGFIIEATSLWT